ncbi:hypothetical protein QJS66_23515 (plasmid) [Kocuria rhizophila]|nr:hypothetical protein QJS66_23515 [Kocuria rhizophila]
MTRAASSAISAGKTLITSPPPTPQVQRPCCLSSQDSDPLRGGHRQPRCAGQPRGHRVHRSRRGRRTRRLPCS